MSIAASPPGDWSWSPVCDAGCVDVCVDVVGSLPHASMTLQPTTAQSALRRCLVVIVPPDAAISWQAVRCRLDGSGLGGMAPEVPPASSSSCIVAPPWSRVPATTDAQATAVPRGEACTELILRMFSSSESWATGACRNLTLEMSAGIRRLNSFYLCGNLRYRACVVFLPRRVVRMGHASDHDSRGGLVACA